MDENVKEKLAKVYALVNNGATEGERVAARKALDRILWKYNISKDELNSLDKKNYYFKYATELEKMLFVRLFQFFNITQKATLRTWDKEKRVRVKELYLPLTHLEWVTLESSYEYFRRHIKKEWNRVAAPEINRCRKAATKTVRRKELEPIFFSNYVIASKLVNESELTEIDKSKLSKKEFENRRKMDGIEGGEFNRQLTGGLLLD
jgi:hypothetical protein